MSSEIQAFNEFRKEVGKGISKLRITERNADLGYRTFRVILNLGE